MGLVVSKILRFLYFRVFAEIAYSRPFLGEGWAYFPQIISLIVLTSKRNDLAIKRENRFSGSTWAQDRKKVRAT